MAEENRDVLDVLKSELEFLERGGYKCCLVRPWRPQLAFIESRTCKKYRAGWPQSCSGCVLMQFVPPGRRDEKTPCWDIPLDEVGHTVDSFYRWGTEEELEQALRTWLWSTMLWIEDERRADEISRRKQRHASSAAPAPTTSGSETTKKGTSHDHQLR